MRRVFLLAVSLLIGGCAAIESRPQAEAFNLEHHVIYVDQFGNLKYKTDPVVPAPAEQKPLEVEAGKDQQYVGEIIDSYLARRAGNPQLKLVVFVHGGLNTFDTAWGRAQQFAADMVERENRYPVFIGWNSGPFSNYRDHVLWMRRGERKPVGGPLSSPFVLLEDIARSVARIPAAWVMTVKDPFTVSKFGATAQEAYAQDRLNNLKDLPEKFHIQHCGPYVGVGASWVTVLNPVKLVSAPFVDGFGTGAWDSMLRRTDLVLSKSLAFEGKLEPDRKRMAAINPERGNADTAVTELFRRLENLTTKNAMNGLEEPVHMDLIGHSMGAIVVNNILARHPELRVDNVVFMGAAAPIKDIENGVVPWMRRAGNKARFFNLSLDPYREIGENTAWDFLPRGSLLHWIDNIFGAVNSFKDRTAGGWWNIVRTAQDVFPSDIRPRVYLTRFPIGGESMGPQEHGQFDDYRFWEEDFWLAAPGLQKFVPSSAWPNGERPPAPPAPPRPDCFDQGP